MFTEKIQVFNKMPKYYSPLRYPGGKTSLLNFLELAVDQNFPIDTYIEPFAGGAGAAVGLLLRNKVKNIILNDADELIFKFWNSLLHNKTKLINKILSTPVDMKHYYLQKDSIFNSAKRKKASSLNIGFATFYINRCNRSGILRSGPIGGYDQKGDWKIDARFNKKDLISRIEKIYEKRSNIRVFNEDAIVFLRDILPNIGIDLGRTLIYLDPPYYVQGPQLYRTFYEKEQHIELRNFLKNELNIKWILSYDDVQYINELYEGTRINGYLKNHFAYKAKVGEELIIVSDNCIISQSNAN